MEHKNTFAQVILLVVLVILGIIAISVFKEKVPLDPPVMIPDEPVACTMEARMCPDGSYVGRQGPKCEFSLCPVSTSTSTVSITVSMGEKAEIGAFTIKPLQILEDSRCPVNVQCIQAGTVRLRTEVGMLATSNTENIEFTLAKPISLDASSTSIKLSDVSPVAMAGTEIGTSTYKFTFITQ